MNSRVIKKFMSIVLIVSLVFSFNVQAFAANSSDIEGHWAEKQVNEWLEKGFIIGYEDGSFKPNKSITRAEFMAFVNRAFGFTEKTEVDFSDVSSSDWFYEDVLIAKAAGFISGYEDGTVKPNNNITREEVATIVTRLLDLEHVTTSDSVNSLNDVEAISKLSKEAVSKVVEAAIMTGYSDKSFKPLKPITRAEAIVTLNRAIDKSTLSFNEAGVFGPEEGSKTIDRNVVVNVDDVTLQNMIINGNLLLAEGIGEGNVYLKNVTVNGDTIINGGGEHSIYLENTVILTVIVNKADGSVRLVAQGSTSVQELILQSGAKIEESDVTGDGFNNVTITDQLPEGAHVSLAGTYETVDIIAASIYVEIPRGIVKQLNLDENSTETTLNLGQETRVIALTLNAIAKVLGKGEIDRAIVNANGSFIEQKPDSVELADDVTADIGSGEETTNTSPSRPSTSNPPSQPVNTLPMANNMVVEFAIDPESMGTTPPITYTGSDLATDADGDELSVTNAVYSIPGVVSLDWSTGSLFITPVGYGITTVTASVSDGKSSPVDATIDLTILPLDDSSTSPIDDSSTPPTVNYWSAEFAIDATSMNAGAVPIINYTVLELAPDGFGENSSITDAVYSDTGVVSLEWSLNSLDIIPVGFGTTTVTAKIYDGYSEKADVNIDVSVFETVTLSVYGVYTSSDGTVSSDVYGPLSFEVDSFYIPSSEINDYIVIQLSDLPDSDSLSGSIFANDAWFVIDGEEYIGLTVTQDVYLGLQPTLATGNHTIKIDWLKLDVLGQIYVVDPITIKVYQE